MGDHKVGYASYFSKTAIRNTNSKTSSLHLTAADAATTTTDAVKHSIQLSR
jgi:hypothetical protein